MDKKKDDLWEMAGSLTPELEGMPHSHAHKKRMKPIQVLPMDGSDLKEEVKGRNPRVQDPNQNQLK